MKTLDEKKRKLAEENHKLIYAFLNSKKLNDDEYYGDMAEAYCMAIAAYDPSKGKLSTFVYYAMDNKLKNIYRIKQTKKYIPIDIIVSLDAPCSQQENAAPYGDIIPDAGDVERTVMMQIAWEQIYTEFTSEELEVLNNLLNKGKSQNEMGKRYNVSQATYARREHKVKEKAAYILFGFLDETGMHREEKS